VPRDVEGVFGFEGADTGRDEHYDIVSVLYRALQGADACGRYALDAEAEGRNDPAAFFREAQTRQAEFADRAKELPGIGGEPGRRASRRATGGGRPRGPPTSGASPTSERTMSPCLRRNRLTTGRNSPYYWVTPGGLRRLLTLCGSPLLKAAGFFVSVDRATAAAPDTLETLRRSVIAGPANQ
jgi:hypothetical protein